MKKKSACVLCGFAFPFMLATLFFCGISTLEASWLIDEEGFHASVHGQISCLECHDDISKKKPHPDPGNVNKTLEGFFRIERCEDCHLDVLEDIDEGTHGGEEEKAGVELAYCIGCHEPHYQMSAAAREAGVDLSRPAEEKCSACHEFRDVLPRLSAENEGCMGCHRRPGVDGVKTVQRISSFCFHCHGTDRGEEQPSTWPLGIARIDVTAYPSSPHSEISCLLCHPESAQYAHSGQASADCLACHVRHDEKVTHYAHLRVSCEACHLRDVSAVTDAASGRVEWRIDRKPNVASRVHQMVCASDEEACRRCHVQGNTVGAAAMILPARSVICMPCHAATMSMRDTTTIIALLVFAVGLVGLGSVWLSGSLDVGIERREGSRVSGIANAVLGVLFSIRIFYVIKALILDGLLQRRLFRQAKARWAIHSLIFLPFLFRFGWGVVALVASLFRPDWRGTWILLDRDHPATAFLFDLTGVMVILGVVCAVARRIRRASEETLPGLPRSDRVAGGLLAGIVLVGFVLEAMRIAMTGTPSGSEFAFVGYGLSRFLTGVDLTGLYGYGWYAHTILTGVFVAYLPFSRMIHMITAPIALALNAGSSHT